MSVHDGELVTAQMTAVAVGCSRGLQFLRTTLFRTGGLADLHRAMTKWLVCLADGANLARVVVYSAPPAGKWLWFVALACGTGGCRCRPLGKRFQIHSVDRVKTFEQRHTFYWPNRLPGLSCPYPMLSMARLLRLARSSQPTVRGYQYSCTIHTCCASFGSSNQPITPVLRTTPPRKLQICRQGAMMQFHLRSYNEATYSIEFGSNFSL